MPSCDRAVGVAVRHQASSAGIETGKVFSSRDDIDVETSLSSSGELCKITDGSVSGTPSALVDVPIVQVKIDQVPPDAANSPACQPIEEFLNYVLWSDVAAATQLPPESLLANDLAIGGEAADVRGRGDADGVKATARALEWQKPLAMLEPALTLGERLVQYALPRGLEVRPMSLPNVL